MRRGSMLALIDATMTDLRRREVDPNAHTVFAGDVIGGDFSDDMTEVNLDLEGALESVVEQETRVERIAARQGPMVDLNRAEIIQSATVNHRRAASAPSWAGDISELIEQEFATLADEDDLPELDSGEFFAVPSTDDLILPRSRSRPSLIRPEPPQLVPALASVPLAAKGTGQPVRIVVGTPLIALFEEKKRPVPVPSNDASPRAGLAWASAIAFWAASILGAWACRMELYELIGL